MTVTCTNDDWSLLNGDDTCQFTCDDRYAIVGTSTSIQCDLTAQSWSFGSCERGFVLETLIIIINLARIKRVFYYFSLLYLLKH